MFYPNMLLKQSPLWQGTAQFQLITPHQPVEGLSLRPEKGVYRNEGKQDSALTRTSTVEPTSHSASEQCMLHLATLQR
jgi:hypothetical protein